MKKVIDNLPSQRSHRLCDIQAYNDYYLAYLGHITRYESQRKLVSFSTPHAMCASVPDVMSRCTHACLVCYFAWSTYRVNETDE